MAGETSGPGPSEQEIRMVALERKFDELLSFVQLIAKRNTDDENQRKEDDKDTSEGEPEGTFQHQRHSTKAADATKARRERLPFKAPEFEKYNGRGDPMIHLQMYCRKMAPYADNEPLLIQTFQDTLTGNAAEWYSQLKKISHWKELADTFLAQYGFNSQIAPDRFDLQRMEKKSNETFREYAQRWREKGGSSTPATRRKRDDQDLLGERIEDALKTKKIVDMTALMALAEQAAKKAPTKKKEGDVQMIGRSNGRPRQALPTFTMQPIQPRPTPMPAPAQAPTPAPVPQMPARPVGNQANDNRLVRKEPRQFTPLPMPLMELYPILIEKNLISPVVPRPYNGPQRRDFDQNSTCDFHFGEVGHTVNNCQQLRHRVQDLIDHGILKFEGLPNITTNPLPNHPEGSLECCEEFKKKVTDLMENGLVGREEIPSEGSHQPDDPSDFDWYAELNLDDIVEDEMDLEITYRMKEMTGDTSWRMILTNGGTLISPNSSNSLRREDGLTFGERAFDDLGVSREPVKTSSRLVLSAEEPYLAGMIWQESSWKRYRFNPHSILEYLGLKEDEEPYVIPDPGVKEKKKRKPSRCHQPKTQIASPLPKKEKSQSRRHHQANTSPPLLKKNMLAPMVEGLSIHTITGEEDREEDSTTPPTRHCQQGEEAKMWTCVPLLQRVSSSNDDILEALERQDEGSKPNIEELEIVNLANEGEEPREVKIGTRCATEQKEALIALLREFHEIFAWSYQDMPGLDTDIVVHKIPLKARMQARQTSTATNEARSHFEDQGRSNECRILIHGRILRVQSDQDGRRRQVQDLLFVTHWGTFVYDVMPFGLKNAGATYQRAMVTLFHDMIHHEIEVYVDDMIAKSRTAQDHLTDLRKAASSSAARGIEIDPAKVQAIRSMPAPKTEKEIRSFLGRINYIARFIAQLTATCEPLFKLLRKDVKIKWTEDCQKAFDKIKEYLLNPPILVPPTPGRPLILYLTVQEASMGCMLGQQDETGKKEQAIYYLSKKFTEPETRYLLVEEDVLRTGLGLQEAETVHALLHHLVGIPDGPDQAIKGQAIADYLADYPSEQLELMDSEFPDEDVMTVDEDNQGRWKLYFDGAANAVGSGIGAVLVSPKGQQTPIAVKLGFDCTNNMTEYEACIVVSQTNGEWQARDPKLIPYQRYISRLVPKFKYVTFTYTPRAHNHFADALRHTGKPNQASRRG
uniref:RNase H type-1 domain-containing protein n=1 Tax=Fagus sylvatica TaxID=28930 RepID=A0A2N9H4W4_FAGSY